jgi:hypothetical protein
MVLDYCVGQPTISRSKSSQQTVVKLKTVESKDLRSRCNEMAQDRIIGKIIQRTRLLAIWVYFKCVSDANSA